MSERGGQDAARRGRSEMDSTCSTEKECEWYPWCGFADRCIKPEMTKEAVARKMSFGPGPSGGTGDE